MDAGFSCYLAIACAPINRVPKWAWLQAEGICCHATSYFALHSDDVMYVGPKNGFVNGKFVQRRYCELAVERYHGLHLELLQYDMYCYYIALQHTLATKRSGWRYCW